MPLRGCVTARRTQSPRHFVIFCAPNERKCESRKRTGEPISDKLKSNMPITSIDRASLLLLMLLFMLGADERSIAALSAFIRRGIEQTERAQWHSSRCRQAHTRVRRPNRRISIAFSDVFRSEFRRTIALSSPARGSSPARQTKRQTCCIRRRRAAITVDLNADN